MFAIRKQRAQEKIAIDTHKQEEEAQKKVAIAQCTKKQSTKKRITTAQKKEQSTKAHSYCTNKEHEVCTMGGAGGHPNHDIPLALTKTRVPRVNAILFLFYLNMSYLLMHM